MLVHARHLSRIVSLTVRHTTSDLLTQHSPKEYVVRLEQKRRKQLVPAAPRPDLSVLRGNSEVAQEARKALAEGVRAELTARHGDVCAEFEDFRKTAAEHALRVCGPVQRSCRKPWLRNPQAASQIKRLNDECLALGQDKDGCRRHCKRRLVMPILCNNSKLAVSSTMRPSVHSALNSERWRKSSGMLLWKTTLPRNQMPSSFIRLLVFCKYEVIRRLLGSVLSLPQIGGTIRDHFFCT